MQITLCVHDEEKDSAKYDNVLDLLHANGDYRPNAIVLQ